MTIPLIPRAVHGGPQAPQEQILDFSVNTNPLGPNLDLLQIWQDTPVSNYPDPTYTETRCKLGHYHHYSPEGVVLGVGASELLHRIARAFLQPGSQVISLGAPFGEFERAVALQQGSLQIWERSVAAARTALQDPSTRLIYLSNPHNPTGHFLDLSQLFSSTSSNQDCNSCSSLKDPNKDPNLNFHPLKLDPLLVIDEAYLPFWPDPPEWEPHPQLIRVRSPGKVHGLLGLRMAYALMDPEVAIHLINLQPAWAIPAPLAAVLGALPNHETFIHQTLASVRTWARELALALKTSPTPIHFFTVEVPNASQTADQLRKRQIRVRDCSSFGLPHLIRIATRTPAQNQILIQIWRQLYG